ncbi:hypothetical protein FE783_25080 [Paenibacillus mesophilus]|uniref:hypothetical protein n=1 Tax=Paenibacillus mesophilus TaxID=2582849 RepID=UPI00110E3FD6|nr:hypothetical protein [Paenibacillus mesophilus]TMV46590.1 hypothetical protein FE783_25080 [Paenibacillus mesophilus]
MTTRDEYTYTDFHDNPSLISEIVRLEERLQRETGQDVTLIAYSPADASPGTGTCRAGLND